MNLKELPRITIPSFPDPGSKDQKTTNQKFVEIIKSVFVRDGDKEKRIRAIEDNTGIAINPSNIDHALLDNLNSAAATHLSAVNHTDLIDGGVTNLHSHANDHARLHSIISTNDHTSAATPGYLLKSDANGLPVEAGTAKVGGAANYSEFEADGTLVFNGDATVWDDMRVVPGSFDRPGTSDPTIVAYDVNAGGISTYLWQFAVNNIASFTIQLPHAYKVGTDIYAHIHWTPGPRGVAENGKTVGWKIDYSWANIDGSFPTMQSLDLSNACDGTNHKHQMTPEVVIDGHTAAKGISSMLICNIKRTDTGADDTWAGTISGQLPMLLEIDFHYQIDTVGSRQQSAK
jgi:hypothetical protein